jgi:hypothetical protein
MKAFEKVTGEKLDEEKKELATEELITTTELADELKSDDKATGLITAAKEAVIKSGTKDEGKIEDIIKKVAKEYGVELTDEQLKMIKDIMIKVAKQDYDYDKIKSTLSNISEGAADKLDINIDLSDITKEEASGFIGAITNFFEAIADFFKGIGGWFSGLFGGDSEKKTEGNKPAEDNADLGILNNTDESILGDNVITNSTDDDAEESSDKKSETSDTSNTNTEENKTDNTTDSNESNGIVETTSEPAANDTSSASQAPTTESAAPESSTSN